MKPKIKQVIMRSPLGPMLRRMLVAQRRAKEIERWRTAGCPVPPPHMVKQQVLLDYARTYKLNILVETGTLFGDMVEAMKNDFSEIFSIELSLELYRKAQERFRGQEHIHLVQGDSGQMIGEVLNMIRQPTLFWLDGHYSGNITARGNQDTPILAELSQILVQSDMGHVMIIDDARLFGTDPAYPTLAELERHILSLRPDTEIVVSDDSVRVTP